MRGRITTVVSSLAVVAFAWWFSAGCATSQERAEPACSSDAECVTGTVCRLARCKKACPSNRWVGEPVTVRTNKGRRKAVVSGCRRVSPSSPAASVSSKTTKVASPVLLWVRYESGIEEQVEARRTKPVHAKQGHATTAD